MNKRENINTLINNDVKSTMKFLSELSEVVYDGSGELSGIELRNTYFIPIEMLTMTQRKLVQYWITDNELLEECYILKYHDEE